MDIPCLEKHSESFKILELLLSDPKADPNYSGGAFLKMAIDSGNVDLVKILINNSRVNLLPLDRNNYLLRVTCINNRIEVLKLLLADQRIDPSRHNNEAIYLASFHGHPEIVKLLLTDKRVKPEIDAIEDAFYCKHFEIVKLLIPYVDLSKTDNLGIHELADEMKNNYNSAILKNIINLMENDNMTGVIVVDDIKRSFVRMKSLTILNK